VDKKNFFTNNGQIILLNLKRFYGKQIDSVNLSIDIL